MISILILTLNEELNISGCLSSLKSFDDIVVLDSFSSDRTLKILEDSRVRIFQRKFDDWASHQNWAMENISFKYDWVFYLDADERMSRELETEIFEIAKNKNQNNVAFYCGRKNFFMGKWIKHAMPPGFIMRFFKPKYIRFERLVNPTPVINGNYGYLKNYFEHYNFSKGLSEWIEKHNKYSSFEAHEGIKSLETNTSIKNIIGIKDPSEKRKLIKKYAFKLPFRSVLKFLYLFFYKLGFLDGYAGFSYCLLQSFYEYMIVLKMKELQMIQKGKSF